MVTSAESSSCSLKHCRRDCSVRNGRKGTGWTSPPPPKALTEGVAFGMLTAAFTLEGRLRGRPVNIVAGTNPHSIAR